MATVLDSFMFDNSPIRIVVDENSNLWFVARDVAEALEYSAASLGQPNNLMQNVPEEWKGHKPIMTPGGSQDMLCLSEQGLYFFLGRSDKPKALPFQMWLAGEVLPSIRKTGGYVLELNLEEIKQIVRLPEPYKREAFKRLLVEASRQDNKSAVMRTMLNIILAFAAAETGTPLEQARLTF